MAHSPKEERSIEMKDRPKRRSPPLLPQPVDEISNYYDEENHREDFHNSNNAVEEQMTTEDYAIEDYGEENKVLHKDEDGIEGRSNKKRKGKKYKIVCQLLSRKIPDAKGYFFPDFVGKSLCTHMIINFGVLDPDTLTLKAANNNEDVIEKTLFKAIQIKNRGTKVVMSIGPDEKSNNEIFGKLLSDSAARKKFIEEAVIFLKNNKLNGLQIDWDEPQCEGGCDVKKEYVNFIKELRDAFKAKRLTLSIRVSPSLEVMDKALDVAELSKPLNWVVVKAYDYFNHSNSLTDHVAPFYKSPSTQKEDNTVDFTVREYLRRGLQKQKLVLGIPFHGIKFRLKDDSKSTFGSPTIPEGREHGKSHISYKQVCNHIKHDKWDKNFREMDVGPYAYKGNLWVSFDNAKQVKKKSNFVKKMKLAGVMGGTLGDDDNDDRCCCEPFPLYKAMNRVLGEQPTPEKSCL